MIFTLRFEDRFPEKPIAIYDIVTDFELALMGAVSDVMDVESRGCWFHYGQAIIRKSGMLHLNRDYRRRECGSPYYTGDNRPCPLVGRKNQ